MTLIVCLVRSCNSSSRRHMFPLNYYWHSNGYIVLKLNCRNGGHVFARRPSSLPPLPQLLSCQPCRQAVLKPVPVTLNDKAPDQCGQGHQWKENWVARDAQHHLTFQLQMSLDFIGHIITLHSFYLEPASYNYQHGCVKVSHRPFHQPQYGYMHLT